VEVDGHGRARRFFRSSVDDCPSPGQGQWRGQTLQHIGIYAFTRQALEQWMALPELLDESVERLEQLRPLAGGMTIGVAAVSDPVPPGVDTEEDLRMAEAIR